MWWRVYVRAEGQRPQVSEKMSLSREEALRSKWELKAKSSYSDLIGSSNGGGRSHNRRSSGSKWEPGHFPNVPNRFRLGASHNTPFNNNLFYAARIDAENARIGVPEKHAKKPAIFDRAAPPKTGREREHKAFRYGANEGFGYIKNKHARTELSPDEVRKTREKLESLEDLLRQSQAQRKHIDKAFDAVLSEIIDGVGPAPRPSNKKARTKLSLQEQIERRKNARRRRGQRS